MAASKPGKGSNSIQNSRSPQCNKFVRKDHSFNPHVNNDWKFAPLLVTDKQIPEDQNDIENQIKLDNSKPIYIWS